MYSQNPCSVRNSETPLSAADIAAAGARLNASDAVFDSGNSVLGDLISFLGGNASSSSSGSSGDGSAVLLGAAGGPSSALPGGAGIPTGAYLAPGPGGGGVVWRPPRYNARQLFPSASDSYTKRGLPYRRCVVPDVLPLVTVFQVPLLAAPPPASAPPPAVAPADCGPVTSSNVCQLIRDGCVLSSQVSPAQLAACSAAGWVGNRNLYPAIAARGGAGGGRYYGDVNLDPPAAAGVSGLGDTTAVPPPWYCMAIPGTTMNTCDTFSLSLPFSSSPLSGPVWAWAAGGLALAALLMSGRSSGRRR